MNLAINGGSPAIAPQISTGLSENTDDYAKVAARDLPDERV